MKETILKSWKTTVVGLVIIGYYAYKLIVLKETINPSEIVSVLIGAGFIASKDATASHTK